MKVEGRHFRTIWTEGEGAGEGTCNGNNVNIRSGPGTNYDRAGSLTNGTKVTIVEEKNGWGKLLQGGWVSLDYIV
jgi:uncharacterized protein YraI